MSAASPPSPELVRIASLSLAFNARSREYPSRCTATSFSRSLSISRCRCLILSTALGAALPGAVASLSSPLIARELQERI